MKHPFFTALTIAALFGAAACESEEGDSLDEGAQSPADAGFETVAPGATAPVATDPGVTTGATGNDPGVLGAGSAGTTGTGTTTGTAGAIDTTAAAIGTGTGTTRP